MEFIGNGTIWVTKRILTKSMLFFNLFYVCYKLDFLDFFKINNKNRRSSNTLS